MYTIESIQVVVRVYPPGSDADRIQQPAWQVFWVMKRHHAMWHTHPSVRPSGSLAARAFTARVSPAMQWGGFVLCPFKGVMFLSREATVL